MNVLDVLNALIIALAGSGVFGLFASLLIQIGKLYFPTWFPDNSADNWRLGIIVFSAVLITVLQLFGVLVDLPTVERYAQAITTLGTVVMPLLVLFASWIAKQSYLHLWKGVWKIGKSYTPLK